MRDLLIIDLYNMVIRSLAVHQDLEFNGVPTGGLYGTLNQLATVLRRYQPEFIVVCKDSPPYTRKKYCQEYKQDRKKRIQENATFYDKINTSIILVEDLLKLFSIPVWAVTGLEADDLIATLVLEYHSYVNNIYTLSNDSDLFQLLTIKNLVLLRKNKEYTQQSFALEYPTLNPLDWILATALSGTHNGVKGLKRVGLKTAIRYLANAEKLEKVYLENKELIETNMDLITLPFIHQRISSNDVIEPVTPQLNESEFARYLDMYGIRYTEHLMLAFDPYSTRKLLL